MGVATHLGIDLREYDARIRTFIPDYEEMLDVAAAAVPARTRTLVDLGTGTGALAARCLAAVPGARGVCIDGDAEILQVAARRLRGRATFTCDSFLRTPLPPSDAVVASFSLHHIRTRSAKAALYRRIQRSLRAGGAFSRRRLLPGPRQDGRAGTARRLEGPSSTHLYTGARRGAARRLVA